MKKHIPSAQTPARSLPVRRYSRMLLIVLAMFASVGANDAGVKNRRANRLYEKGQYEDALKLYDEALEADPSDGKLKMNRGSALYRLDEFDEAERSYLDALSKLPQNDKKAQADAHYNLGNVQFRQGETFESAGDASSARGKYAQALENYINTLKMRPNDSDAKWNLQLAHQKIDLMRQMQEQQSEQDGDEGDQSREQDSEGGGEDRDKERNSEQDERESSGQDEEREEDRQNQPPPQDKREQDMRRDEAERLIEQFADDDENLNRPPAQRGRIRQPERDW